MSNFREDIPDDPVVSSSAAGTSSAIGDSAGSTADFDESERPSPSVSPPEVPDEPPEAWRSANQNEENEATVDSSADSLPPPLPSLAETVADPQDQPPAPNRRTIRIAVAGCSHGEMDKIYASLEEIERQNGYKIDLLISCGDYQAVRNYGDLHHMHVNEKYRQLQTFYRYYSGEAKAPILTLFVGGNHEASGYLSELPFGGWVAPSIYYMGHASVVNFAGLRIAGLSGIFKRQDYEKGHYECPPFAESGSLISAYHVRSLEIFRLKQLKWTDDRQEERVDIVVSHDWPATITDYGDKEQLLRIKPFFADDIARNQLGNPATMDLIHQLHPRYWLAAHLHVGWAALVPHANGELTRFLALDKPIPRRHFIQVLEFPVAEDADLSLSYDPTWLAILRNTDQYTCLSEQRTYFPSKNSATETRWDFRPLREEMDDIAELGDLHVPLNFLQTAPPHTPNDTMHMPPSLYYKNPQTTQFCRWLGITDLNALLAEKAERAGALGTPWFLLDKEDAQEIPIDDDDVFGDSDADFVLDSRPRGEENVDAEDELADVMNANGDEALNGDHDEDDIEVPTGDEDGHAYLEGFEAPKWRGSVQNSQSEETPSLKRRKVDLDEDED